jgi:hypothetical protein
MGRRLNYLDAQVKKPYAQFHRDNSAQSFAANTFTTMVFDNPAVESYLIQNNSGGDEMTFQIKGIYLVTLGYRAGSGADVWTTHRVIKTTGGAVVGHTNGFGQTNGDPSQFTSTFLIDVDDLSTTYKLQLGRLNGTMTPSNPSISDASSQHANVTWISAK